MRPGAPAGHGFQFLVFAVPFTYLHSDLPLSRTGMRSNRIMTGRELRNQRRAAERKAKKLKRQNLRKASGVDFTAGGPTSAESAALPPNPELLDEFTMEEQAGQSLSR